VFQKPKKLFLSVFREKSEIFAKKEEERKIQKLNYA
jgi:hypothetical protein